MNRLSIRADDIARIRVVVPGFGGGHRAVAEFSNIAGRCAGATDAELATASKALVEGHPAFEILARIAAGSTASECTAVSVASQIAHVADDALRAQLRDLFCTLVGDVAGRSIATERRSLTARGAAVRDGPPTAPARLPGRS